MFRLFIGTVLMYLPIAIPCGMLCFLTVRWILQRKNQIVRRVARVCVLCCLSILIVGIVYGILRFSGTLVFAEDNIVSYNWFDASYRDEGFRYIYNCGVLFLGLMTAVLFQKDVKAHQG